MPGHFLKIPIAKDGYMFFGPVGAIALILALLSWYWAAGLFFLLSIAIALFFRDPERAIPQELNVIVSPADGTVDEITTENDPFLDQPCRKVSIFLSVLDVHINRSPINGKIENRMSGEGKYLDARSPDASRLNTYNALLIDNGRHKVVVKQIVGLLARRIVCWANKGDEYHRGQRFGLIRFGSRTDLFLPADSELKVKKGDKVAGGSSIIGYLPE